MANYKLLGDFILSWEGGYANIPNDRGGATNKGVTISTWKAQGYDKNNDGIIDVKDLKIITEADAINVMKKNFWDKWKADLIKDQNIANILVDWVWCSGKYGITLVQKMLDLNPDGIVGDKTIQAINNHDPKTLFAKIHERRKLFLENIVKNNPSQKIFLKGWLRRLEGIQYGYLKKNNGGIIKW